MRHVEVQCDTPTCPARGQVRRVQLHLVALDVIAVPRLVCARCGAEVRQVGGWSPGQARWEGEHGPELTDLPAGSVIHPAGSGPQEGGDPCPGNSSKTSSPKLATSSAASKPSPRKPAPTAGSRSNRARGGSSTAASTASRGAGDPA